jgi:ankyrin repeat/BTB/POZ domain-containing protein 1
VYDYSKTTDPLQPLASHITSLLTRDVPKTSDIALQGGTGTLNLHKFLLSARSPYFRSKFQAAPESTSWNISDNLAPQAVELVISFLYLGQVSIDSVSGEEGPSVLAGVEKLGKILEVKSLADLILETNNRKVRQMRTDEVSRCQTQLIKWFEENVLAHKLVVEAGKGDRGWIPPQHTYADVIIQADEVDEDEEEEDDQEDGIKVRRPRKRVLFPVHRAMLLRSDMFFTMFSSSFREAERFVSAGSEELQIIPLDYSPEIVELVLRFLYTEETNIPIHLALDTLFAADQFFLEKLKSKAALVLSAHTSSTKKGHKGASKDIDVDIYDVVRAGWLFRIRRLEEFGAKYIADRMEEYIDDPEFAKITVESANRIQNRQETDTIELIDE